jgi:hypothetical protein
MEQLPIRFQTSDFIEALPDQGYHPCVIHTARPRVSERGNPTVQVVYELDDADPSCDRVTEYFIVAGATPQALRIGRRRLLTLCRACGLDPKQGDELKLAELVGRELQIRIGHDTYEGQPRVRVLGYRPL